MTQTTAYGMDSYIIDPTNKEMKGALSAGLRKDPKVIIGCGQMEDTVRKYTGADAYGEDATPAVAFAKEAVGVR